MVIFFSLTGVKPFKCNVCDTTFTTNGSLSRHMITHIKSYKCSICGYSFRTSLLCKKHLKKEHAIDESGKATMLYLEYNTILYVLLTMVKAIEHNI